MATWLRAALDAFTIEGLTTNRAFLNDVLETQTFTDAAYDTGWLERWVKERKQGA